MVYAANSGRTTAQFPIIADDNSGGTYTRISTADFTRNTNVDSGWIFIRTTLIGSAVSTVFTMTQSGDTGGGLCVFKVTGMNRAGSSASKQAAVQNNQPGGGTPAPVFGSTPTNGNPIVGVFLNGTNGGTNESPRTTGCNPGGTTAYTEQSDLGYNTPNTGMETMTCDSSGETGGTITWGAAAPNNQFGDAVIELDASCPAGRFWVGGTGNWNDTAKWAGASNGAGGCAVPTSSDSITIDATSCPAACTITVNASASMASFTDSGFDGASSFQTMNSSVTWTNAGAETHSTSNLPFSCTTGDTISITGALTISGGSIQAGTSTCTETGSSKARGRTPRPRQVGMPGRTRLRSVAPRRRR